MVPVWVHKSKKHAFADQPVHAVTRAYKPLMGVHPPIVTQCLFCKEILPAGAPLGVVLNPLAGLFNSCHVQEVFTPGHTTAGMLPASDALSWLS